MTISAGEKRCQNKGISNISLNYCGGLSEKLGIWTFGHDVLSLWWKNNKYNYTLEGETHSERISSW